jgi:hypothetical protein
MPEIFTSNFDELLELARRQIHRTGKIRHFHGRLPLAWTGVSPLRDPPVVTTRDYQAAEAKRYVELAKTLRTRFVVLLGLSLADPNLARLISNQARDCWGLISATPRGLSQEGEALRVTLLRRFWAPQGINVVAIQSHEELPAFLLHLRRRVEENVRGRSLDAVGETAWKAQARFDFRRLSEQLDAQQLLLDGISAVRDSSPALRRDRTLQAGLFLIRGDGWLEMACRTDESADDIVSSSRRSLYAGADRPWGAAGYAMATGNTLTTAASGSAYDRNVPDENLYSWQLERAQRRRLPPAEIVCRPVHVTYGRRHTPVGVAFLTTRSSDALTQLPDLEIARISAILQASFERMMASP